MKHFNTYFLILLILCAVNFFGLQIIKGSFFRYIQYGYLVVAIIAALPYFFVKEGSFNVPVRLIFLSAFFSIFIATIIRNQRFVDSFIGTVPVLVWGTFFYFKNNSFEIEKIEKIVIYLGLTYLVLYFFQFTHPNKNYFIEVDSLDESRGILRIVFPGRGIFYLMTFMAINKLTTRKQDSLFWISLTVLGLLVTVMQVTRQFILGTLIIYSVHFLRNISFAKKIGLLVSIVGIVVYALASNDSIVTGLLETQEQTKEQGFDYVRVRAAEFFITNFSVSPFTQIFGNGVPYGDNSPFLRFYGYCVETYGYWLSDVGLVAIYAMFGIFAVLGYIIIWIKSFTLSLPKEYQYLKYYLWFLLLTSLTSDTIYSPNDLIITVLVLYMFDVIHTKYSRIHSTPLHSFDSDHRAVTLPSV